MLERQGDKIDSNDSEDDFKTSIRVNKIERIEMEQVKKKKRSKRSFFVAAA